MIYYISPNDNNSEANKNDDNKKLNDAFDLFKEHNDYLIFYMEHMILAKHPTDEEINKKMREYKIQFGLNVDQIIKDKSKYNLTHNYGEIDLYISTLNINSMTNSVKKAIEDFRELLPEKLIKIYNNSPVVTNINDILNKINSNFTEYFRKIDKNDQFFQEINNYKECREIIIKFFNNNVLSKENAYIFVVNIITLFNMDRMLAYNDMSYYREQSNLYYELLQLIINSENNSTIINNNIVTLNLNETIVKIKEYNNEIITLVKNTICLDENQGMEPTNEIYKYTKMSKNIKKILAEYFFYKQIGISMLLNKTIKQFQQLLLIESTKIQDINILKAIFNTMNKNTNFYYGKKNINKTKKAIANSIDKNQSKEAKDSILNHIDKLIKTHLNKKSKLHKLINNDLKNIEKNKNNLLKHIVKLFNINYEMLYVNIYYYENQSKLYYELLDSII